MDRPREACGIFAVFNHPDAVELTYYGLFALQHRGQESAGIACVMDGRIKTYLGMGLVGEVFTGDFFDKFKSRNSIGHTRYSTAGSSNVRNAQPITVDYSGGQVSVAHNGNLSNGWDLRRELEGQGSIFQTTSDSEVVLHLLARPEIKISENPIAEALKRMQGAFSFVFLTNDALYATRDPQGFRPLALGKLGDGYVVASETCAFDMLGIEYIRDIEPGELLRIDDDGLHSRRWCETQRTAHCIFEHVYFARPDSRVFGLNVHIARKEMGKQLARESHVPADIVVPVPDSGTSAAQGYAEETGLPLEQGFIRNHYVGRTFIAPSQGQRDIGVKIKLNAVRDVVAGKRVIVVDDSIIRGTTSRGRVKRLYDAGAKEVHLRISCPPTRHPCFYGIDFPDPKELIANQLDSVEKIREFLGIDSLAYLSIQGLRQSVGDGDKYCSACFTGEYPVAYDAAFNKTAMETRDETARVQTRPAVADVPTNTAKQRKPRGRAPKPVEQRISSGPPALQDARRLLTQYLGKLPQFKPMRSHNPRKPDVARYVIDHKDEILGANGGWKLPEIFHGYTRGGDALTIDLRPYLPQWESRRSKAVRHGIAQR